MGNWWKELRVELTFPGAGAGVRELVTDIAAQCGEDAALTAAVAFRLPSAEQAAAARERHGLLEEIVEGNLLEREEARFWVESSQLRLARGVWRYPLTGGACPLFSDPAVAGATRVRVRFPDTGLHSIGGLSCRVLLSEKKRVLENRLIGIHIF